MKPIFTVHEGEFLVGDHINRRFHQKYDVWLPTKDNGVDLLVTRRGKRHNTRAAGLQVKFSRCFAIPEELSRHLIATSWFTLDPKKIRRSQADIWVFVIMTLRHDQYFVLIPKIELQKRMPRGASNKWNLYLWVYDDCRCYQVRELKKEEKLDTMHRGVRKRQHDFTEWLENWELIETVTKSIK
jgi:hypothetical protein